MNLNKLKYFLERAAECQRLAESAVEPQTRETLLHVASRWWALAAAVEGQHVPQQRDGEPLSSPDEPK